MNLERFHKAQENSYSAALAEIKNGRKYSCWMWYVFPQLSGLGQSPTARFYGISDLEEAREYLKDEILGSRLIEISNALLALVSNDAYEIFGFPDVLKLKSSMTLFALADPNLDIFQKVLDKFFGGERDENTIRLLEQRKSSE
mgnify:FL=1